MDMDQLTPIGYWGDFYGNEEHLSFLVPVFEDSEGTPYTTSNGTGNWSVEDLKNVRGTQDYFTLNGEVRNLVPEGFPAGWNIWTVGSGLEQKLFFAGIDWKSMLPEGRTIGRILTASVFVGSSKELQEFRDRLRSTVREIWLPVVLGAEPASPWTKAYLDLGRKLDHRADTWDRIAYYYLTSDDDLSWELRAQELRGWEEGEWSDRVWVRDRVRARLKELGSAAVERD